MTNKLDKVLGEVDGKDRLFAGRFGSCNRT